MGGVFDPHNRATIKIKARPQAATTSGAVLASAPSVPNNRAKNIRARRAGGFEPG